MRFRERGIIFGTGAGVTGCVGGLERLVRDVVVVEDAGNERCDDDDADPDLARDCLQEPASAGQHGANADACD